MSSPAHWPCWDHPCLLSLRPHSVQSAPTGESWGWGSAAQFVRDQSQQAPRNQPRPSAPLRHTRSETGSCPIETNQHYPPWIHFSLCMERQEIFCLSSYKKVNQSELLQHRKYKKMFLLCAKGNRKFVSYLSCSDAMGHLNFALLLASSYRSSNQPQPNGKAVILSLRMPNSLNLIYSFIY